LDLPFANASKPNTNRHQHETGVITPLSDLDRLSASVPPQINHQKTTICTTFFAKPPQKHPPPPKKIIRKKTTAEPKLCRHLV
jgi:hypothetical protein